MPTNPKSKGGDSLPSPWKESEPSMHGSYTLSARGARNPAAVNPKCANTDSAGPKTRAARRMGIVHAE